MKLIIRDQPPKETPEEIIEVWLERVDDKICVKSRSYESPGILIDVNIYDNGTIRLVSNGRFKSK